MKKHSQESGFALLMTLVVVGVVLSVGMSILDLSIKQVRLSTNAKESEIAFHAANAGMECARYWRRASSSEMESGLNISPTCFNENPNSNSVLPIPTAAAVGDPKIIGDGEVFLYSYDFTWGPSSAVRCTRIDTLVASSSSLGTGVTTTNMSAIFSGYPQTENQDKFCEPGSRCTVISVRGYNRPCGTANGYGTVEREVLLQF